MSCLKIELSVSGIATLDVSTLLAAVINTLSITLSKSSAQHDHIFLQLSDPVHSSDVISSNLEVIQSCGMENLHLSSLEVACKEANRVLQCEFLLLVLLKIKTAQMNYHFLFSSDNWR